MKQEWRQIIIFCKSCDWNNDDGLCQITRGEKNYRTGRKPITEIVLHPDTQSLVGDHHRDTDPGLGGGHFDYETIIPRGIKANLGANVRFYEFTNIQENNTNIF
jgi:hypothetical protein